MNSYVVHDSDIIHTTSDEIAEVKEYVLKVRDLPREQKPREKIMSLGPTAMSSRELLAVLLGSGTTKEGVLAMASRLIREYGEKSILSEQNPVKLSKELDIPIVRACQIVACGELGRRFYEKDAGSVVIRNARDVYEYLIDMRNLPKEHLRGLYLNAHNKIIHDEVISIGTVNSNIVHPREVFRPAIQYGAAAIVLAHNHPSGEALANGPDEDITRQLIAAGKIMGIRILDHVIITKNKFTSIHANYSN
jgi:DNA repair protein RadC